jgi:hypothetical protein
LTVKAAAPVAAARVPEAGDIYALRSDDTGRYGAYQVTHVNAP